MRPSPQQVTYWQIARFFIPLGLTPLMIAVSHTLTSATLARLPAPELNLAAYAVLQALTNAVKSPIHASRQLVVALVDGKESFRKVMAFLWSLGAGLTAVLLALALTPLGTWALRTVGLTDQDELSLAGKGLYLVFLLPAVEILRNTVHALAINHRGADMLPVGLVVRTVTVALLLWFFLVTGALPGVVVGTLAWTLGIGIEGAFLWVYLMKKFGSLTRAAHAIPRRGERPVSLPVIVRFFVPLAVMVLVGGWMQPLIQGGVGRSDSPTLSLAAYGVALGLYSLMGGGVSMVHQCTLVFVRDPQDPVWRTVRIFALGTGLVIGTGILLITQSAVGRWVVMGMMGVPELVGTLALQTLSVLAILPVVGAWKEAYWGMLMLQRRTSIIGVAKVANLATAAAGVFFVFGPLSAWLRWDAAVIGAMLLCVGEAVEATVVWGPAQRALRGTASQAQAA